MNKETIKNTVEQFFAGQSVVYATPGTPNHTANFYGDDYVCPLTPDDVCRAVECAAESWSFEGGADPYEAALDVILSDLQHEKPEEE